MGNSYKIIIFSLVFLVLFSQSASALTFNGFTDKFNYKINETINYTGLSDQNLTSNVTIYLLNASGLAHNFTLLIPNATNFTAQLGATVPTSGEYFVKANFTFNNTYFESSSIVKISRAHSIVISTNKPNYSPGETINFTVRATDVNNIGVANEHITVRFLYSTNDTVLDSSSGSTNSAGEYKSTFRAPNTIGSYRLTVNNWVAVKVIDISNFDLVAFTGDVNGNIKTKFAIGDTAYIFMDLFGSNKTRYAGTESLSVQLTYPNGTQNSTVTYTFSGSRLNTSFIVNDKGMHNVKVTIVSTSKSVTLPVDVGKYEIAGWLEKNSTQTNNFFPNEAVNIRVKTFNVSTGEVIKTALDDVFELTLLESSFANFSSIANSSTIDSAGVRTFTFNSPNTTGLYYVRIRLNQSQITLDMKVTTTLAIATPVDQSYNFKNVFVGNKQTARIITTLSNSTAAINVTNVSVASVRTSQGADITSSLTFNASLVDYKNGKAGLIEFSSPPNAGLYFIKTLANNNFAAETQFLVKLYTACAQLDGYKWFISSNEDANLTVRVSEAQDVGFIDSISGNASDSTNTEGGANSFSGMYGLHDCYASYKTTASGSSVAGNNTANIRVTVTKIINTLNGEDVTTKVATPSSNNTDDNGRVTLRLPKPSGGWDGGTYVVQFELRDQDNNTDKGFGSFQVKNLWVNIWPKQISGRWKWYFSPTENMSFDVNAYNSTGTWYYYGQNNGAGDNCTVSGLFYTGNGAEWFWPPKPVPSTKYSATCTNASSPAKGRFNLTITPNSAFDTGYYMVRVKVNTTGGVGDVGDGWFNVKAYNVYARSLSTNYYDSWYRGASDNVSLTVDITYANSTQWGCYWQACPTNERVNETLNVSIKLINYDEWKPKDYATSKYNASMSNSTQQNISTAYINTTNGNVNITLIPRGGKSNSTWETGYYSAVISVDGPQGKETGTYWFEIRSFFANLQPVKPTNFQQTTYSYTSSQNITINVSTTNRPSWLGSSSYGVSLTNVLTNITAMKLSYWAPTTTGVWQMNQVPVVWAPNSTTNPNPTINGTTTVNVTPASTLATGNWYNLEVTLTDSNGNNQTGWASFEIKDFTFAARTKNWQYTFNNTENMHLDVAVCDNNISWCNFGSNIYTGSPVTVTVTKLMKSDSWPYTDVSGWTANSSILNSTNNGQGIVTITPTSALSGGYYSAELKATPTSGSAVTTNAWFKIESFKFSVNTLKGEYNMAENVTLQITTGSTATLSNAQLTCGYPPDQTSYSLGSTLAANSTSLSAGTNLINLSPTGGNNWVSGYCNGYVTVTSGGESQTAYVSFNMKAFTASVSQPKYKILRNESAVLKITSDANQRFNVSNINISFWNYSSSSNVVLRLGTDFTTNATNNNFTGSATITVAPISGNWTARGWHNGNLKLTDSTNAAISQIVWFYFDVNDLLTAWGYSVSPGTSNSYTYNTTSQNVSLLINVFRYNTTKTNVYDPFEAKGDINITVTSIESQSCTNWPCTYSTVTGWSAPTATSKSDGTAHLNITRSSGWTSGWYYVNVRLEESPTVTATLDRYIGFWVNS